MIAEAEVGRKQDAELGTYSPRPRNLVRADGEGEGGAAEGIRAILPRQVRAADRPPWDRPWVLVPRWLELGCRLAAATGCD